jgi:hypothetical protein
MLAAATAPNTIWGSMVSKASSKTVAARVIPGDLDSSVAEAVKRAPGSTSTQLVKVLPTSYRTFGKEVRAAADRLAAEGKFHRHLKGKTPLFFPADPLAALDAAIPSKLAGAPLDKDALKRLVEEVTPGHGVVLDDWLKRAVANRQVYEHAPTAKGAKKRFGSEPDLRKLAAPLIKALRKAREGADAQGIPRQRLVQLLLEELGVSLEQAAARSSGDAKNGTVPNGIARTQFIAELTALGAENPRQALLSVRDLRARLALGKEQFDALALALMRDGAVSLHHHDHPASLPEPERRQLVQDGRGTYYVGIAPRSGQ